MVGSDLSLINKLTTIHSKKSNIIDYVYFNKLKKGKIYINEEKKVEKKKISSIQEFTSKTLQMLEIKNSTSYSNFNIC